MIEWVSCKSIQAMSNDMEHLNRFAGRRVLS